MEKLFKNHIATIYLAKIAFENDFFLKFYLPYKLELVSKTNFR